MESTETAKSTETPKSPQRKYYPLHQEARTNPDAVVVHCSDPGFQEAFRLFLKGELGIEHYAPIVVPGSVSSVAPELVMPKHLKTLKDNIEFMIERGKTPKLILINHEDCKMYAKLHKAVARVLKLKQANDLVKAASLFKKLIPVLTHVNVYMARLDEEKKDENKIYFEKIV
ncbi:MAG: hypothetical protein A3G49_03570 [Candidatus Sungbacteria bacterium RIFCSPLOWO2_12_FULL_41_11]|uniref:Carbonic anhydrase n=1 Tax=Candidatus Sungbacteria bacterium RIFCSPLOWO2_12_FULL_41_11 TaxID=1802286 RepID=A0A1G2LV59_9BACT|nr:MAG: hypothetical protein A3G49_03570 [Candidatus Sungbacteria bacterium RIFCSPLOWO2_12_FULL_41_11]